MNEFNFEEYKAGKKVIVGDGKIHNIRKIVDTGLNIPRPLCVVLEGDDSFISYTKDGKCIYGGAQWQLKMAPVEVTKWVVMFRGPLFYTEIFDSETAAGRQVYRRDYLGVTSFTFKE
ncbi:MAG: hypothetical protein ACRYGG_22150 [Janthinobacterium lividum]